MSKKFKLILEGVPYEIEHRGDLMVIDGHEFPFSINQNSVTVNSATHSVEVRGNKATVDGFSYQIEAQGLEEPKPGKRHKTSHAAAEKSGSITAIMPGLIIKILKKEGEKVEAGEKIIILEAMKMQNELESKVSGTIKQILVKEGESVEMRQVLAVIE
ncbi:MAG: biotin/lipoyl-containing protein [Candidatus Omnitrophota bacterium]